jgi:VIT1/CCC1 family predicted Fe2+/Mn2+ transporter
VGYGCPIAPPAPIRTRPHDAIADRVSAAAPAALLLLSYLFVPAQVGLAAAVILAALICRRAIIALSTGEAPAARSG